MVGCRCLHSQYDTCTTSTTILFLKKLSLLSFALFCALRVRQHAHFQRKCGSSPPAAQPHACQNTAEGGASWLDLRGELGSGELQGHFAAPSLEEHATRDGDGHPVVQLVLAFPKKGHAFLPDVCGASQLQWRTIQDAAAALAEHGIVGQRSELGGQRRLARPIAFSTWQTWQGQEQGQGPGEGQRQRQRQGQRPGQTGRQGQRGTYRFGYGCAGPDHVANATANTDFAGAYDNQCGHRDDHVGGSESSRCSAIYPLFFQGSATGRSREDAWGGGRTGRASRSQTSAQSCFRTTYGQEGAAQGTGCTCSYVRSWAAYVGQLTKTLSDQFTEQEKAMAAFSAAETKWSEKLQDATTALAKLSGGTQHIISDSEDMEVNEPKSKNYEAEDDPWKTEDAARDLRERQLELVKMIQQRHEQASASMSDSEASKREGSRTPRRREKDGADTTAHPGDAQT